MVKGVGKFLKPYKRGAGIIGVGGKFLKNNTQGGLE